MRAHRISPKIPASVIPMASTTAIQPSGMASIAVRVEIGDDQDSGVARSSRAGTKRKGKAGPISRGCPGRSGREPRIQTFRRPFLSRTVVMVAVDTRERVFIASGGRGIENRAPGGMERGGRILRGTGIASRAVADSGGSGLVTIARLPPLIAAIRINLLNSQGHLPDREFHFGAKGARA